MSPSTLVFSEPVIGTELAKSGKGVGQEGYVKKTFCPSR